MCSDNNFRTSLSDLGLYIWNDGSYEGQCHGSNFTVTEEKNVAEVVGTTSNEVSLGLQYA